MPTLKKKIPSSRPLKGSIVAWTARRYSVSASKSPATKAPIAMESPALAARMPVATITNNTAAINNSSERWPPTRRKSGRSTARPTSTITASTSSAWPSAVAILSSTESPPLAPRMPMKSRMGTTATSCASSTEKLARPPLVSSLSCCASNSSTMAVEESAKHAASTAAIWGVRPKASAMTLITTKLIANCSPPRPSTSRRIAFRRSKESSSPIRNSRKTTPSSAIAVTLFASITVNQ